MKKTINFLAILLLFSMTASICKKEQHRYIYLKNNSGKAIYYGLSYSYPDTSLIKIGDIPGKDGNISHKISIGTEETLPATNFAYNSTMLLLIFDTEVIEKEPWDSIVAKYKILKRYQFTEQDMQNRNWTITYP